MKTLKNQKESETCHRCGIAFEETEVRNIHQSNEYHDMCVYFQIKEEEDEDKNPE